MASWPPHSFVNDGLAQGRDRATLLNALEQARVVQDRGLPAVLTLRHIAELAEVTYASLREVVERKDDPYRVFHVAKRKGGKRTICVPSLPLLRTQRWIARNVLAHATPHSASTAYAPRCSPVLGAIPHLNCRWLVKLDVRSLFESISERQVYRVFRSLGYQPLVSFEMTRLCTRLFRWTGGRYRKKRWRSDRTYSAVPAYTSYRLGHLPQGAPTSPMLSNLAMVAFDQALHSLATQRALTYSRYADDLAFSTCDTTFTRRDAEVLIRDVFLVMRRSGLTPQKAKTTIAPPGARKLVLGLLVNSDKPRLRKDFKRSLEQHVFGLAKFGVEAHARHRGFDSLLGLKRHVHGLLAYASSVEPSFANELQAQLNLVAWPL